MKTLVVEALVWTAVVSTVFFCFAMLRMRDAYQLIQYLSPPAAFAALIAAAIFLQQGAKPESFKALFIVLVLLAMNSVVSHATARAFRVREMVDWRPPAGQEVPISQNDEIVP